MLKSVVNIQNSILAVNEELAGLEESLQNEFEFFASAANPNEVILKAKKKQQRSIKFLMQQNTMIFNTATTLTETETLLQACAENLGVPLERFLIACDGLIDQTIIEAIKKLREPKQSIPEPGKDPGPPVKIACKPVLGIKKLKEMSEKGIRSTGSVSVRDLFKNINESLGPTK